jgi:hypothetical protein
VTAAIFHLLTYKNYNIDGTFISVRATKVMPKITKQFEPECKANSSALCPRTNSKFLTGEGQSRRFEIWESPQRNPGHA